MRDIKLTIDGRTIQLTEEQIKRLDIKELKNPFERAKAGREYCNINAVGNIVSFTEAHTSYDDKAFYNANYCTDEDLIQQQAYRETLNRRLWRYSMENGGDKIKWKEVDQNKYCIYWDYFFSKFGISSNKVWKSLGAVYFISENVARRAIEEIAQPFMDEHPDFKF